MQTLGNEESVRSFTVDQVDQYYVQVVSPKNMVLTLVGDVDPKEVKLADVNHLISLVGSGPCIKGKKPWVQSQNLIRPYGIRQPFLGKDAFEIN